VPVGTATRTPHPARRGDEKGVDLSQQLAAHGVAPGGAIHGQHRDAALLMDLEHGVIGHGGGPSGAGVGPVGTSKICSMIVM
jgi:pyruvate/2-oxoglutarate dehydrogenase complex dihydrolipoamide acyltransferase (E2) component